MIQLRFLKKSTLYVANTTVAENGYGVVTYTKIGDYLVQTQNIAEYNMLTRKSEVETHYNQDTGATLGMRLRAQSPRFMLENYLRTKMNETADNITNYILEVEGKKYRVNSVKDKWIDIELV